MRSMIVVIVALVVLATLYLSPRDIDAAPDPKPAAVEVELPPIPPAEAARENPVAPTAESIRSGMQLFASQCAMCHGVKGDGTGELALRLGMTMPDLTAPRAQADRSDGARFYIITHGHGRMPADDRLSEARRWDMVNAIRNMSAQRER